MSYLAERFQAAVTALVGDGSIKERLAAAYGENLDDLEITEFPAGLRRGFKDLHNALHATIEARAHAGTIVMLYTELVRHGQRGGPLRVVSSGRSKPPKYLSEGG
jgi:hypothetical protein